MPDYRDRVAFGFAVRRETYERDTVQTGIRTIYEGGSALLEHERFNPVQGGRPVRIPVVYRYFRTWPSDGWHYRWCRVEGVGRSGAGVQVLPPLDSETDEAIGVTSDRTRYVDRPESWSCQIAMRAPMPPLYTIPRDRSVFVPNTDRGKLVEKYIPATCFLLAPLKTRALSSNILDERSGENIDRWSLWEIEQWDEDGVEASVRGILKWRTTPALWKRPNTARTAWEDDTPLPWS